MKKRVPVRVAFSEHVRDVISGVPSSGEEQGDRRLACHRDDPRSEHALARIRNSPLFVFLYQLQDFGDGVVVVDNWAFMNPTSGSIQGMLLYKSGQIGYY